MLKNLFTNCTRITDADVFLSGRVVGVFSLFKKIKLQLQADTTLEGVPITFTVQEFIGEQTQTF